MDTGAKVNFICINLASELGLDLHPGDLVKGGNSVTFQSLTVAKPISFKIGNHIFTKQFFAVKNLLYPMILGIGWWRKYDISLDLQANSLCLNPTQGPSFSLALMDNTLPLVDLSLATCKVMAQQPTPITLTPCIEHLAEVFDVSRENRLPKNSQFDFSVCLTFDLLKINSPIYPLTLKEEEALDA
ncbi:hypothetical protein DSO57_1003926 [Entomophthora muscae]|uniref:Uncharacterized protein n=1 Tax=Entomophthora muscae TaxID=34485 RepID=A0ACC2RZF2_9FUNG|nr:hypothetical protein DSO57_1003926 [Entomophthora muscae]